jgi:hypothetical protein
MRPKLYISTRWCSRPITFHAQCKMYYCWLVTWLDINFYAVIFLLLCDDHISAGNFVVERSRKRYERPSPRPRRTRVFKDLHHIDCLARVGWRFADGDGYRSKEPIKVSNIPFPILSARRFPVWKRRSPLLNLFRLFASPCKLGLQIWGIGACTLRTQWTSTSALRRLRSPTGE